jgi:nitric oxide reductase large subunit
MSTASSVAEAATTTFVTKAGYTVGTVGTAGTLYFGRTSDEWTFIGAMVSMAVAVLGFLVGAATNFYFKHKHYKLAVAHASAIGDGSE